MKRKELSTTFKICNHCRKPEGPDCHFYWVSGPAELRDNILQHTQWALPEQWPSSSESLRSAPVGCQVPWLFPMLTLTGWAYLTSWGSWELESSLSDCCQYQSIWWKSNKFHMDDSSRCCFEQWGNLSSLFLNPIKTSHALLEWHGMVLPRQHWLFRVYTSLPDLLLINAYVFGTTGTVARRKTKPGFKESTWAQCILGLVYSPQLLPTSLSFSSSLNVVF